MVDSHFKVRGVPIFLYRDMKYYDSVLAENISKYISDEEFKNITGKNLYKNSIKNINMITNMKTINR